ncbi:MAG: efflux RND transporter periplasmic adaptor subunit [Elusimicrobia bacterium]|nr:efflux RND transporter periplasmic adaptor subunit [Candidatus Obscuribacterium magneticum]
MKKKLIVILLIVIGGLALLWQLLPRGDFLYAGTVEATEVDLSARVSSQIASYEVREGDVASRGQLLVQLSCEDIKINADLAEKDYQRAVRLHNSGSISDEAYDQRRFKRDDALLRQGWCTIAAPSSGTILNTYFEAGEYVTPGTKLLTLADLREVWAYVYVAQPVVAKLSLDLPIEGRLPEMKNKRFKGRITHINQEAEFTPKNVQTREERTRLVYGIKVTFPNPDGILKPGMTIEVKLPD